MRLLFYSLFWMVIFGAHAQSDLYKLKKIDDGLYHLYYDSSTAKSSIIEFDKYLAVLEVPIKNEGGGAQNLKDHQHGGERLLATLKHHFPKKPLKYLLHTHWHPHSISSLQPFLANGTTVVTTQSSVDKLKTFIPNEAFSKYGSQIQMVTSDSLVIKDKVNKIVVHRFMQKEFPNTPTSEYLYFFLPRYRALHTGCMFTRWRGEPIEGKELITGRMEDIERFLERTNLKPECFLRGSGDQEEAKGMIPYAVFANLVDHGIRATEITRKYLAFTPQQLRLKKDSIVHVLRDHKVPTSFINSAVYASLRKQQLIDALNLAQIQIALAPDDPNSWDTLGEVYYFMNDREVAKIHEKQSRRISPTYTQGGEKVWHADLEEYRKQWK